MTINRTHVECALKAVENMLPDPHVPGIIASDDEWGAAVSAGKVLLGIGLENVQGEDKGEALLRRTQDWLVALLQAGALGRRERVDAGGKQTCNSQA